LKIGRGNHFVALRGFLENAVQRARPAVSAGRPWPPRRPHGFLHKAAAFADQAYGVGELQSAGGDQAEYSPKLWPAT
jgi:hypothetical protein